MTYYQLAYNQGSYTFPVLNFNDFSRTFQYRNITNQGQWDPVSLNLCITEYEMRQVFCLCQNLRQEFFVYAWSLFSRIFHDLSFPEFPGLDLQDQKSKTFQDFHDPYKPCMTFKSLKFWSSKTHFKKGTGRHTLKNYNFFGLLQNQFLGKKEQG